MGYDFRAKGVSDAELFRFPGCVDLQWLGNQRVVINHFPRIPAARIYTEQIVYDFDNIRPVLPESVSVYADIGCGLGGINVLLYRHWQPQRIYLCEKRPEVLECANRFLRLNAVHAELEELAPNFAELPQEVEFAVSLFAMGCHFKYRPLSVPHVIDCNQAEYGPLKGRRLYSDGFKYTRLYIR